ncbi:SpoIIE family protein phosphatase [Paracrocinitomix mangrovi]|uniref:PP2C family protein-serine/threonine phosphatase n=1 Tax=Paracrocinitomix mangrovi TaxID=2862509 RepID=UPI001C8D18BB|nr:7TM diverse intracellular signaling domain-containing protein [Paracrocinitomix mangrovi]UKN00373.1 SpoIIE family protein phosphatase [Paracrocinitomix mangrovi]
MLSFQLFSYAQNDVYAEKGVIDFSQWDTQKDPSLFLKGNYEFYWNQLIYPGNFSGGYIDNIDYQSCDDNWNKYKNSSFGNLPAQGYATYRVRFINLPEEELNIMVKSVTCAVRIYFNGELASEIGKVGTKKDEEQPKYDHQIIPLPHGESNVEMIIHLSNFHHRNGGFNNPWYIGTEEALYGIHRKNIMLNGIEGSAFLFAGLFFLTLYIFRRKDKALLYFSLYALTFFIRPLVSFDYMITTIWPDINWTLLIHIEYLSLFLPGAFMLLFIRERFKEQAPQKLMMIIAVLVFLEAFVVLVTPTTIFTHLPLPHQLISFVSFALMIYVSIKAMKDRVNGAVFATIAMICLILSSAYTIFLYVDLITPSPYGYVALQMAFLLSMTMILGSKFASQFRKVEYLQLETANQKEEIEIQHHALEAKNEEITSSITYARRIQNAILPPTKKIDGIAKDAFVLYKPKDIVAGDFYWLEEKDELVFIASADCTGHGVPGAMVSVVCNNALNRSIREFGLTEPGEILDNTRKLVIETFDQSEEEVKDGMDIALIVFNKKTRELKFAGANNPLWIVRDTNNETNLPLEKAKVLEEENIQLVEFKGDKQPIGVHFDPKPFHTLTLTVSKNEWIYIFSDGFADQFGGEKGKKMMYKPMKKNIMEIFNLDAQNQKSHLDKVFDDWKGKFEQTDDVCLIGIKF